MYSSVLNKLLETTHVAQYQDVNISDDLTVIDTINTDKIKFVSSLNIINNSLENALVINNSNANFNIGIFAYNATINTIRNTNLITANLTVSTLLNCLNASTNDLSHSLRSSTLLSIIILATFIPVSPLNLGLKPLA